MQGREHRPRLLLADRVKNEADSFLAPLLPALARRFETRFVSLPPGDELAAAIAWADLVWLEWCWDHAAWATASGVLDDRPCIVRLHSIEALQTDFPARLDWRRVSHLITVGTDITEVLHARFPATMAVPQSVIPNGIDLARFVPGAGLGAPDRFRIAWVGHLEPKKNPMLMLQLAARLVRLDPRYTLHVAGAATDLRTARYLARMQAALGLTEAVRFVGQIDDMPSWYADKGVLLSTSMYESFGMNIGEAMAVGAFPVVHDFPGADALWPRDCLFADIDEAVALIRAARPGLYRDWIAERYGLPRQERAVLDLLAALQSVPVSGMVSMQPSPAAA
jgi:glycosyltransferase involved in cell wall biosynthesis